MCCFSQPVDSVSNTRLFARLAKNGIQHLVYQMQFESKLLNAMILPLPVALPAREDSVRFVSLENYGHFFEDLSRGFPALQVKFPPTTGREMPDVKSADSPLVVHQVGDYVASFVPSVANFSRLDPQFVIPKESWDKLPEYADYGFAVFQLKELAGEPHPMALEFDTRWPEQIFFPTVHIHDGEVHEIEDFDHMLYLQDAAFDEHVGTYRGPEQLQATTGYVRSKDVAHNFCRVPQTHGIVDPNLLVHRLPVRGRQANRDIVKNVSLAAIGQWPARESELFGNWPRISGALSVAGLGLGWLIHRRMRLSAPGAAKGE